MIEDLTFLEEGEFTKQDWFTRALALKVTTGAKTPWGAISRYVNDLRYDPTNKEKIFRNRAGMGILESGFVTGCDDTALAFIVLSRASGIPTKYVETLEEDWVASPDPHLIRGHIFTDIFVNGAWQGYEPKNGFTLNGLYQMRGRPYVEVGKGLDFSQVYLKENGIYRPQTVDLRKACRLAQLFQK